MYKIINKCRVCSSPNLSLIFSLGQQTLTGVFPKLLSEIVSCGPVDLVKCSSPTGCGLVQLKQSYNVSEMYSTNYGYRSGLNKSMVNHLLQKIKNILNYVKLNRGDTVIDIGSNDGTSLSCYRPNLYKLYGVDPTANKFLEYYRKDIKVIPDFFSINLLKNHSIDLAKIITSFSMFYDLEDPIDFAKSIKQTLHKDGVWIFEQSYLPFMLKTNSFDTICHEHLEFYSLKQILYILKRAGLKVIALEFNDINGGSISVSATHEESLTYNEDYERIESILWDEKNNLKLDSLSTYIDFNDRIVHLKESLMRLLRDIKQQGKSISVLGASTKGNVLLQYYGITNEIVDYIGEVNPDKFNAYTPGTLIPIIDEEKLLSMNPDYLIVLPWHFKDHFIKSSKYIGKLLIFPLPVVEIITP
jgi:NDP-4-keto-2,6-dideoxyhexose 3-C-methyltransferase